MTSAIELAPLSGIVAACAALGVARATFYRARQPVQMLHPRRPPPPSPLALSSVQRETILHVLQAPEYVDRSAHTVFAMLLDAGRYLGSVSSFYRILRAAGQSRARRDQLTHPAYAKPELLASAPRQLWSWDITKLKGPAKWQCFHLYVILDVFSRYVVGWMSYCLT